MKRITTRSILYTLVLSSLMMMAIGWNAGQAANRDVTLPATLVGTLEFKSIEIGDMIVFHHQRMIEEAIVEQDHIVYQLDKQTGRILKEIKKWREGLPDKLPPDIISRDQAEAMVEGVVQFSNLYYISPDTMVFKLEVTPTNPCWIVQSVILDTGHRIISIIDAVKGEFLGYGLGPPAAYTAFSLSGPQSEGPCSGNWATFYQNAADWFDTMGYSTETAVWPLEPQIQGHVQSKHTALFYEIGHSQYTQGDWFTSGCVGDSNYRATTATDIHDWMVGYTKMPFTFIASCYGMCQTGPGKLSYEFRKGSMLDTATVGFCNMSELECHNCWPSAYYWQDGFFNYLNQGWTMSNAYNQAIADKPWCTDCILFVGDSDLTLVPMVYRDFYGFLKKFLKEYREYRIVWPPDPVIKRILDRVEAALNRAVNRAEEGNVGEALVNVQLALGLLQEAGEKADIDTSEKVTSMLNEVSREIRGKVDAVSNADDSPEYEINLAWWEYYQAMRMLDEKEYNQAMQQFRVAHRLVNRYGQSGEIR